MKRYIRSAIKPISDETCYVTRELALQTDDIEVLEDLSNSWDRITRKGVAKNPSTPEHILRKLAEDSEGEVREGVICNPQCPEDLYRQLAFDRYDGCRRYAARSDRTPIDLLYKLADDSVSWIRDEVITNPSVTNDILLQMVAHYEPVSSSWSDYRYTVEKAKKTLRNRGVDI